MEILAISTTPEHQIKKKQTKITLGLPKYTDGINLRKNKSKTKTQGELPHQSIQHEDQHDPGIKQNRFNQIQSRIVQLDRIQ